MDLKVKTQEVRTILEGTQDGYNFNFEFSSTQDIKPTYVSFNVTKEQLQALQAQPQVQQVLQGSYYADSQQYSLNLYGYSKEDIHLFNTLHDKVLEITGQVESEEQKE